MLSAILKSIDDLSDDVKKHYTEKDGKFYLDVGAVDGYTLENTEGLRSALSKERESVSKLEKDLKAFDGFDVTKTRDALKELEELKASNPDEKIQKLVDAKIAEVKEAHGKTVAEKNEAIVKLTQQYADQRLSADINEALSKHTLVNNGAELLMPHIRGQVQLKENSSGQLAPAVIDSKGQVRVSLKPDNHDNMSVGELLDVMAKDSKFAVFFKGDGARGSGGAASNNANAAGEGLKSLDDKLHDMSLDDVVDRGMKAQEGV